MKRAIVNADDFGLSSSVNHGIIKVFKEGILTSTSLLVNADGSDEALRLAKSTPGLGVGIHLCLSQGRPISHLEKIRTLIGRDGNFLNTHREFALKLYRNQINLDEVEYELSNQVKRALDWRLKITHLDSHQHLHLHFRILKVIIKLAKKFQIRAIRYIRERPNMRHLRDKNNIAKYLFSCLMAKWSRKLLKKNSILHTDYLRGMFETGNMSLDIFKQILLSLNDNSTTEIICHAAKEDEDFFKRYPSGYQNFHWQDELKALLDPSLKLIAKINGLRFINYADI